MRIKSQKAAVAEIDMTPMIDIVFQLIAFFMVITNFEQIQADERVKLPSDSLAKPPETKAADELVLNIGFERNQEGEITDPQAYVFYTGEKIPVLKFGPKLEQEARIYKQKNQDPNDVPVKLRSDAQVDTGLIQDLIKLAQENGFTKFSFVATQKTQ
ncbi:ExbD/TolR family protein [Gimesia aquarii]|uniref:Biopolymer transport protein ExbD/TolR n=1 Tax=Gimesia aquarii TaxID=2527964 RepID=A0A517VR43_9PLAN|nr:biopolymer transporter ExbD [Gimesia aquarii]QDT95496.1 Biopolymer transport protein ExbD/TolR [Gimesia aquarii]